MPSVDKVQETQSPRCVGVPDCVPVLVLGVVVCVNAVIVRDFLY